MERRIKGHGTVGGAARAMARLCGGTAGIQAVPRSCASYWHARSARVPFAPAYDRPRRSTALAERDEDSARLRPGRSEEHTSELQSLMRNSYAVFCLKKTHHPP